LYWSEKVLYAPEYDELIVMYFSSEHEFGEKVFLYPKNYDVVELIYLGDL
jgi:hypothetical protein